MISRTSKMTIIIFIIGYLGAAPVSSRTPVSGKVIVQSMPFWVSNFVGNITATINRPVHNEYHPLQPISRFSGSTASGESDFRFIDVLADFEEDEYEDLNDGVADYTKTNKKIDSIENKNKNKTKEFEPKMNSSDSKRKVKTQSKLGPGSRIIGSTYSLPGDWPWQASIQYLMAEYEWRHFCGGSLIGLNWVVTAAHCVIELDNFVIRVVLGDYQLSFYSHNEQVINPSKILMHKLFIAGEIYYDIALIKLSNPARVTSHVNVIHMASEWDIYNKKDNCKIAGWGNKISPGTIDDVALSDYLMQADMTVMTRSECRHAYDNVIDDMQICIKSDTASCCLGDSGGPLVCDNNGSARLVGLASWTGSKTCQVSVPNVYTRISFFRDWAVAVMDQY